MSRRKRNPYHRSAPGDPPPLKATAQCTVRFQEVDLMRVVWHGRYVDYFEEGRVALGKAYGLDYPDFFREFVQAPIVRLDIQYQHFLRPGDSFRVETCLHWSEAVRLNHSYEIFRNSDNLLVASGNTVQLLVDTEGQLFLVWPEYFQKLRERWKRGELVLGEQTHES